MATSIAAFYSGAKVCHVEAGLRTHNKWSPFPEEINRQVTGRIADIHFAPTETSKANLLLENINKDSVVITGNTVIDALMESVEKVTEKPSKTIQDLEKTLGEKDIILVTGHRRENHGDGFEKICKALKTIAIKKPELLIVYPVHLNPKVKEPVNRILGEISNIMLIDPLAYQDFIWMMNRSKLIITDSGGVQEEAPSLGKPVLVMRDTTERPEAVEAGTVILVGTNTELIVSETLDLLNNTERFKHMSTLHNPYGDGKASKRIVEIKASHKDIPANGWPNLRVQLWCYAHIDQWADAPEITPTKPRFKPSWRACRCELVHWAKIGKDKEGRARKIAGIADTTTMKDCCSGDQHPAARPDLK
jgi:UDP-N-acetylglucosamine 2-epimerase (non-hydrolysing)